MIKFFQLSRFLSRPIAHFSKTELRSLGVPRNTKIKLNQDIQKLSTEQQFKNFYQENIQKMNLVNQVTYLRRYTDMLIDQKQIKQQNENVVKTLECLLDFIDTKSYKYYGDKNTDIARSFSQLLSLCSELLKHLPEKNHFLKDISIKVLQIIEDDDYVALLNQTELANTFRCLCQMELLDHLYRFHMILTEELLFRYRVNNLIKVWHAISFLHSPKPTIRDSIFNILIQKIKMEPINDLDLRGLFLSLRHQMEENQLYQLFQVTSAAIIIYKPQITLKTVGVIMNQLANLHDKIKLNKDFQEYLEQVITSEEKIAFSPVILAHILKFYAFYRLQCPLSQEKIVHVLENQVIQYSDSHEFFGLILQSLAEINYVNERVLQLMLEYFKSSPPRSRQAIGILKIALNNITIDSPYKIQLVDYCVSFA